jgi:hypothetical protein
MTASDKFELIQALRKRRNELARKRYEATGKPMPAELYAAIRQAHIAAVDGRVM